MTWRFPQSVVCLPLDCPWHEIIVRVRRALRKAGCQRQTLDQFTSEIMDRPFADARKVAAEWVTVTGDPVLDTVRDIR